MHSIIKPSRTTIVVALVAALLGGVIAGVLVQHASWGVVFSAMTLVAVVCGNIGIKLLRISSALGSSTTHSLDVTTGNLDMNNSVIAAGNVDQSRRINLRFGGLAALSVAALFVLIGGFGTAAISNSPSTDTPTDMTLNPTVIRRPTAEPTMHPTAGSTPPVAPAENLDGQAVQRMDLIASDGIHAVIMTTASGSDPWRPRPYYQTYDVITGAPVQAKASPGAVADGSCGFMVVRSGNRSLILDIITTQQPARGLEKARIAAALRAIDAPTMQVLWTTQIVEGTTDEVSGCNPAGWGVREAYVIRDGDYLLLSEMVVELATGKAKRIANATSGIGDWIAVDTGEDLRLVNPDSGASAGTLRNWQHFFHEEASSFGAGLFISSDRSTSGLAGYALPSGNIAWQSSYNPTSRYIHYDRKTNVFVFSDRAYNADEVLAVSAADGRTLWGPIDTSGVCGVDDGRVVVSVNGQLAVLDAATGTQLSFDSTTSKCPTVLPGLLVREGGSGLTVHLFG
jgi:hypothetical protein